MNEGAIVAVVLVSCAPVAIVLVAAILRGYTIALTMRRRNGRDDHDDTPR